MESCEATNKPDSYEAVYYQKIWYIIMCYCLPNATVGNIDTREREDIYAQTGWCRNKHEEVPIVSLQLCQYVRELELVRNEMK